MAVLEDARAHARLCDRPSIRAVRRLLLAALLSLALPTVAEAKPFKVGTGQNAGDRDRRRRHDLRRLAGQRRRARRRRPVLHRRAEAARAAPPRPRSRSPARATTARACRCCCPPPASSYVIEPRIDHLGRRPHLPRPQRPTAAAPSAPRWRSRRVGYEQSRRSAPTARSRSPPARPPCAPACSRRPAAAAASPGARSARSSRAPSTTSPPTARRRSRPAPTPASRTPSASRPAATPTSPPPGSRSTPRAATASPPLASLPGAFAVDARAGRQLRPARGPAPRARGLVAAGADRPRRQQLRVPPHEQRPRPPERRHRLLRLPHALRDLDRRRRAVVLARRRRQLGPRVRRRAAGRDQRVGRRRGRDLPRVRQRQGGPRRALLAQDGARRPPQVPRRPRPGPQRLRRREALARRRGRQGQPPGQARLDPAPRQLRPPDEGRPPRLPHGPSAPATCCAAATRASRCAWSRGAARPARCACSVRGCRRTS